VFSPTFPELQGLVGLADKTGIEIRPTLLRVLTDLYVQKPVHSDDEERHYVELATRLVDAVDAATRAAIATRLVAYRRAPRAVLERLGAALAADESPAGRQEAPMTMAQASAPVAQDDTARELSDLFFAADPEERRLILLGLDFAQVAPAELPAPDIAADAVSRLEIAALSRRTSAFMTVLQKFLLISREHSARLVEDRSGEPILVAAKAFGMPAEILQRIILFLNPAVGESVQRVHGLALLYDEITQDAALRMVALWRAADPPVTRPAIYRPLHFNDQVPHAREGTAHSARRIVKASERPDRAQRRDPA
jgi:hypothetical protein